MSAQHQQQRQQQQQQRRHRASGAQDDPMDIDDLNQNQNQNPQDIIELDDDSDDEDHRMSSRVRDHNHVASNSPGSISQRRRRRRVGSITPQVIDLVDSPLPVAHAVSAAPTATTTSAAAATCEWSCPQCTLFNPATRNVCNACQYHNPHIVRPPDSSFRDQLISDDPPGFVYSQTRYGNPYAAISSTTNGTINTTSTANPQGAAIFLGGGALLGGMMGAAGSLMNGGSVLSSAAEGVITGAVSGAFIHEALNPSPPRTSSNRRQQTATAQEEMAAARMGLAGYPSMNTAAAAAAFNPSPPRTSSRQTISQNEMSATRMGLAGYPSMNAAANTHSYDDHDNNNEIEVQPRPTRRRARPRASYRVFEEQDPLTGARTTVVQAGSTTTRMRQTRSATRNGGTTDPLLSMLVHSYLREGRDAGGGGGSAGMPNPDNMNYEELLQAFGNGNENMGASDSEIRALPCKTIEDPTKEVPQECLICLEDFQRGETRMTLPCLHGFHKGCAQKWLKTNGSCPICKHKISATGSTYSSSEGAQE
ncbi:MAG: hypothetical protein SGBAC_001675 [Bacillariaceae sp.]